MGGMGGVWEWDQDGIPNRRKKKERFLIITQKVYLY
jgi:hypothetical protein